MKTLPSNITLNVVTIAPIEEAIRNTFIDILKDYTSRSGKKLTKKKVTVGIAFIEDSAEGMDGTLGTSFDGDNRIMVQVRDPYMDEDAPEENDYTTLMLLSVLSHELVHVCQYLTNSPGIPHKIKYNKKDPFESYFFGERELEARILEPLYVQKYAYKNFKELTLQREILDEDER